MKVKQLLLIRLFTISSLFFITTSCGPRLQVRVNNFDNLILETTHLEGIRRTVNIGDVMTSTSPHILYPTLKLEKEATALTSHREKKVSVTLASGEYSYDGHDGQGQYFRAHSPLKILMNEDRMQGIGGIYIPTDSATQAAVYWQWGTPAIGFLRKVFVAYLPNVPPHTISKVPMPRDESEGFLATLTYGGIAQNQIKFIYREYNDGLARAAFTQEVSLDYKPGQLYAYKDARFTVHHADMVNVEYTISKPL